MMNETLKRTPLYETHVALGARLVPFVGWEMPVQYTGIIEEHQAVRTRAGLFDVCHMGEVDVEGPEAIAFVQHLVANDVTKLAIGQALYTPMCTPDAGVIDDLLVYRTGETALMLVINAGNTPEDLAWIRGHARPGARVTDRSAETALLAFQGPRAPEILQRLTATPLAEIKYYWFRPNVDVAGRTVIMSRTGYTGEDGFELYAAAKDATHLWGAILDAGRGEGAVPVGLGARDTLRLEAGYLLHGNDMDKTISPLEAGIGWTVKLDKGDFIGADVLRRQKAAGLTRRLVGFTLEGRAIARHGFAIQRAGAAVGKVTSGSYGPTVEKSIGLGFVPPANAKAGEALAVEIRGRAAPGVVTKLPFYSRGLKAAS